MQTGSTTATTSQTGTHRIERIEAVPMRVPLPKPLAGSTYTIDSRCTIVTRIHTSDGLVSDVYNGDNRKDGVEIARIIEDRIQPLIVGESVLASERIWEKMFSLTHANRNREILMQAIACVDTAVWDLKGRAAGMSICHMLGGYRERLPIFATGGYYQEGRTLKDIGEEMRWLKKAGMSGIKFKVGGLTPEEDYKRVAAAREAAGDEFFIACDANRAWSIADAIRFADLVKPLNIHWFEEPCHWQDDARMLAEVRKATNIPINAGQSEITSDGVRRLLANKSVDIVNFDMSESGGPTEWLRAAYMCMAEDVRLLHHEEAHLSVQFLAAFPNGLYVDSFPDPDRDPIWAKLILNRPRIENGMIEVPTGPGFGLMLDQDMIDEYRE
jgi:D-arabinonate dehydratase